MRTIIEREPYADLDLNRGWIDKGIWPANWVGLPGGAVLPKPYICAYRLIFTAAKQLSSLLHVTADEGYELYLDGVRLGRGPERGDARNWFFESYNLTLEPGEHTFVAKVWALGPAAPRSQMSLCNGFLLSPDDIAQIPLLATGTAPWQVKTLSGYEFVKPFAHDFFSVGYSTVMHGRDISWGWEHGKGEGWAPVAVLHPGSNASTRNRYAPGVHLLTPATLPPMQEQERVPGKVRYVRNLNQESKIEVSDTPRVDLSSGGEQTECWEKLVRGQSSLEIPPNTSLQVIVDMQDYVCGFTEVTLHGPRGSSVRVSWAESLFHEADAKTKGNRNEIDGKYFVGYGDRFYPNGPETLHYSADHVSAGRYVEVRVRTTTDPLTIESFAVRTTRYPWEVQSTFEASDARLAAIIQLGVRALQASSHDAPIDGPYYEQMMWAGDGVQTSLAGFVLMRDDRLVRKMLRLFDSSRQPGGLTAARWPARDTLIIAPYSLLWITMVREFAFWRDDAAFVRSMLPGVRAITEAFLSYIGSDGLLQIPMGWNFVDWVPAWGGVAPGDDRSAIIGWQLVRTLGCAAELETAHGEPELAQRLRRRAAELAAALTHAFWVEERSVFADNEDHTSYSEHTQCEALLSGCLDPERSRRLPASLLADSNLARTTISYSHYLFEAYRLIGNTDALLSRLDLWHSLPERGLLTTPEGPEPTRSDCHAWGSHPIYHFFATILGIRPSSPGFRTVSIRPQLGSLTYASGTMVHPSGEIVLQIRREGSLLRGEVSLPDGVMGRIQHGDQSVDLHYGRQRFSL
ncbi:MAG TPA: alpha-L-rhamnosidase C-terminal domain-containing protein [Candidatus Methylacidiphilales bacterium]|nr:alpha-L-rhamnosidase C-terminal domain-containing protein [Candidatus Methylacidiphilales bacterium]